MLVRPGRLNIPRSYDAIHAAPGLVAEFAKGKGITVTGQGVSQWENQAPNGPELVTNGDFATDSDWNKTNATISGGAATLSTSANLNQIIGSLTVGATYLATYTINSITPGSSNVKIFVGSSGAGTARTTTGTFSEVITMSGAGAVYFFTGSGFTTADIDNVSVKEIYPDLLQATDSARPLPGSLGSELVTNGDFATDSDWTKGTGWTIAAGVASKAAGTSSSLFQGTAVTGTTALVTYTISGVTTGGTSSFYGSTSFGVLQTANGTYSEIIEHSGNTNLGITASSDFDGDIDNVSVKEIDLTTGILFNGIDQFLKTAPFTLNQPTTVYFLGKQVTWTSGDRIADGNTGNTGSIYQAGSTPRIDIYANAGLVGVSSVTLDTDTVVAVVFNGTSSLIQHDNNAPVSGNAGAASMDGFTLGAFGGGASLWSNIQVKAILIYNVAHDAATRAGIINQLRQDT